MRWATAWKLVGGFVLTAVLLGWVLRGVDPAAVWHSLGRASLLGLALAATSNFAHNVFRVWRWGALLAPVREDIRFRPMFSAVILGYTTSWVIPGRLGEIVRPALLSARERVPLGPCMGSVVADRLLDGVAVLVLFAAGIWLTPLSGEAARHAADIRKWSLVFVAAIAVPIAGLLIVAAKRDRLERWLEGAARFRGWIARTALSLSRGIEGLARPRILARVAFHTFAAWLLIAGGTWIGVRACGAEIPFGGMLVILPLLVLGIALPTPGGAGGYHAGMVFGLTRFFAVDEPVAIGAAFLMHLAAIVPVIITGVLFLLVEHIPFAELLRFGRNGSFGSSPPDVTPPPGNGLERRT